MVRSLMKLGVLLSLLTGCAEKPVVPTGPGVSVELRFPVLVVGDRRTMVKDDVESLTRTTVASGMNFLAATIIDSSGARYTVPNATSFGRKSPFFDMGTTPYYLFLQLKSEGKVDVAKAKKIVLAEEPEAKLDEARTLAELIEACR